MVLAAEPVSHFMTQAVLSIDVSSPAGEILRYFSQYPVHHLPVVEGDKVVGMLSSADVLKLEMFLPKGGASPIDYLNQRVRIDRIMRKPAVTIGEDQSLESAARLMAENGIHALPVTDSAERLLGIITTTDVMDAALHPGRVGVPRSERESIVARELTGEELHEVLTAATRYSAAGGERGTLARAVLQLQGRLKLLEHALSCAKRYVNAGQDSRLHAELMSAIERAGNPRVDL